MTTEFGDLLPAIHVLADPTEPVGLREVAEMLDLSPSWTQRIFTETLGESPKHYQRRTRIDLGAALLASTKLRVIDIAFATGFANHETFTRGFVDRYGTSPVAWRANHQPMLTTQQAEHVASTSRCMTFYQRPPHQNHQSPSNRKELPMSYDITTKTVEAIPVLFQQRRVERTQLGEALAECLPAVFGYVMANGLAPAGHPFVRYVDMTHAFVEIQAGIPLVETAATPPADPTIVAGELPAGLVASTIHKGPYEGLGEAYSALERWVETSEHDMAGPPWEVYLTDPGEVPEPADWLTEVFAPLA